MTFRVIYSPAGHCSKCGSVCHADAAVEAYNATVRGIDGWGTADTGPRYREMMAALKLCKADARSKLSRLAECERWSRGVLR